MANKKNLRTRKNSSSSRKNKPLFKQSRLQSAKAVSTPARPVVGFPHYQGHYDIGPFFVAAIDLVGQSTALTKFPVLPKTDSEREEFLKALKPIFGVVVALRVFFMNFFRKFHGEAPPYARATGIDDKIVKRMQTVWVQQMNLSDSTFIYSPAGDETKVLGLFVIFSSCAYKFITAMSMGHPVRIAFCMENAAICVDEHEVYRKNELYGPALSLAHHLENKCVHWPRILVHESVVDYLDRILSRNWVPSPATAVVKEFAHKCRDFIVKDPINENDYILDYLGPQVIEEIKRDEGAIVRHIKRHLSQNQTPVDIAAAHVHKGYFHAMEQKATFTAKANAISTQMHVSPLSQDEHERLRQSGEDFCKISRYYANVVAYYASNLNSWPPPPEDDNSILIIED